MAWFGRNKEQVAAEIWQLQSFLAASLAAADSYDVAMNRVEEGDVYTLFGKLRASHLDYADDFRKRIKKLGGDPEARTGITEFGGRLNTRINSVGSVRDLLIAMRQGEENGVAMAREVIDEYDLSSRSKSLIESNLQSHIDNIRDLSEQIALRGSYVATTAEFYAPQWMRYPKAGFWLLEGALVLVGYLFGRGGGGGGRSQSNAGDAQTGARTSPRAKLGGDQAVQDYSKQAEREIGR